jgi:hypothetical protein
MNQLPCNHACANQIFRGYHAQADMAHPGQDFSSAETENGNFTGFG